MAASAMLIASTSAAHAQNPNPNRITIQQPMTCVARSPEGTDVVVLSTMGRVGPMVPFTVDPANASRLVSVTGKSGKATTLILTSAAPVVWDLRGVASGRISKVVVSGQGAQGVVGLPASTAIEFSDGGREMGYMSGASGCRPISPVAQLDSVVGAAQAVRGRFGKYPDRLYAGQNAVAFDLDGADVTLPTSIDLKVGDVRTNQPIDPKAPKPAVILLKEMVADGTLRYASGSTMSAIRNSLTPMNPAQAPQTSDDMTMRLPESMPPEVRAKLIEARRQQAQRRQESIARSMSYIPNSGIIVTRKVDVLPSDRNGQSAYFLPSDVPEPNTVPAGARLYRLSMPVAKLPPKEAVDDRITTMMAASENGTVADVKVAWNGDTMSIKMPNMDQNGMPVAAQAASIEAAEEPDGRLGWIVAGMMAIAAAGVALWLFMRRTPSVRTPDAKDGQGSSRLDSLEAAAKDPLLKEEVRAFREEAMRLVGRTGMDKDLSDEANTVLRERFSAIADRYLATRGTSEPEAGLALDAKLSQSLKEMTAKLADIRRMQDQRNVDALAV